MLIGELADATGVSTKTLRFYEAEGLLHAPERTPAGYRFYPPEVADRVRFIREAQSAGLTLRQLAEILALRDAGHAPCERMAALVDERLGVVRERLRELQRTRDELQALHARLRLLDAAACPQDRICAAVGAAS